MSKLTNQNFEAKLAQAMQDLPLAQPERSAWPDLQLQMRKRQLAAMPKPRTWLPLAAAAAVVGLVVSVTWYALPSPSEKAGSGAQIAGQPDINLSAQNPYILQSRYLEESLRASNQLAAPTDAASAFASAQLEDLVGLVDQRLALATDADSQEALWEKRVELMQALIAVRGGGLQPAQSTAQNAQFQNAAFVIN